MINELVQQDIYGQVQRTNTVGMICEKERGAIWEGYGTKLEYPTFILTQKKLRTHVPTLQSCLEINKVQKRCYGKEEPV